MKKLLLITYDFPPRGGGGVIRNTKFVKYLPEFGWLPVVLTVRHLNTLMTDDTLTSELSPDVHVERISPLLSPEFYSRYRRVILTSKLEASVNVEEKKTIKSRIKDVYTFFEDMVLVPDNKISWLPNAMTHGFKLLRDFRIDVMMTSAPPHSTHLIGLALKKRVPIPWLIDFRDEWIDNPYFAPKYQIRARFEASLEKQVVNACDYLIANTAKSGAHFCSRFPHFKSKIDHITNGYDEADYSALKVDSRKKSVYTIAYVGSISMKRTPTAFFQALHALFEEKPELRNRLRVEFVGPFYDVHRALLERFSLQDQVLIRGNLSHEQGLTHMVNADALLLLLNPGEANEGIVPGKTYEYLRAKRPILAIVPRGAVSDLVENYADHVLATPDHVPQIKEAIDRMVHDQYEPSRSKNSIRIFDRKQLCGVLAGKLDSLVKQR